MDKINCAYAVVLMVAVFLAADGKKCSKTLSRIPVHKNFDIEKFSGTWYGVERTKWAFGEGTFESSSMEIFQHNDGSYRMRHTGKVGDKCVPVVETVMVDLTRPGHYLLDRVNTDDMTIIVSYTDYDNMALIIFCTNHLYGKYAQCDPEGFHIEILSRSENPEKKLVSEYIKRATKRLCGSRADFFATTPGLCKIPDILEAAKNLEESTAIKMASSVSELDACAVDMIPVQENFDASMMDGTWYEIERTRFTFNKMESVVTTQHYDEATGNLYSHYTGTLVNSNTETEDQPEPECMTAIQGMSKAKTPQTNSADRLGRIGWDDSTYSWSSLKVVYADDEHILSYSCFTENTNEPCVQEAVEISLVGKSLEISQEKRDFIYSLLPENCFNVEDMKPTKFLANCSSWVAVTEPVVKPQDCKLDDIAVYEDYDSSEMVGKWYLYSSINFNNVTSLRGTVLENHVEGTSETIVSDFRAFSNTPGEEEKCTDYTSMSRDMCIDTADHITTLPTGLSTSFVFKKVLYLDASLLVEYLCAKRTEVGTCESSGVQFNVYTRNTTEIFLEDTVIELIKGLATAVCLNPSDVQIETEWCVDEEEDEKDTQKDNMSEEDFPCDVDQITIFSDMDDFVQYKIYGYWYEIAHSMHSKYISDITSVVAFFTSGSNETLSIYYSGIPKNREENAGACAPVDHKSLVARCNHDSSGDYLARYIQTEHFTTYIPYKIIYTDYVNVLVTFACQEILPSGVCSTTGTHVRIWSRNSTLDEDNYNLARDMVFWACSDPDQEGFMKMVPEHNATCLNQLDSYVTEHELDLLDIPVEVIDTEKDDPDDFDRDFGEQRDDNRDIYDMSDIDAAFSIPDDEFYSSE